MFSPPAGFEPASIDERPRISRLLTGSSLENKEIWYISTPASVSLSSIEELSLRAIEERAEVITHNGDAYAFVTDAKDGKTSTKVMVPSSSDSGYLTSRSILHHSLSH